MTKIKGEMINWEDIQDKPFKILLSDLPHAVALMRKLGFDIAEEDGQYWFRVNYPKVKNQGSLFDKSNERVVVGDQEIKSTKGLGRGHSRKNGKVKQLGKCVLCKQWKPEVDAWQHICNSCADKCGKVKHEE